MAPKNKQKAKKKAKKKGATKGARKNAVKPNAALTATPWFKFWVDHPTIRFQRTFGDGGVNLEGRPGVPGVWRLVPRCDPQNRLFGFTVVAVAGDLPKEWEGVTLVPRGEDPPSIQELLPKWDPSKEIKYGKVLKKLVDQLHGGYNRLQRLEGFFPVFDQATGSLNIDRVRIVNLSNVVEGKDDHSLVVLTLLESYGIAQFQNGGGGGPPD